MSSTDSGLSAIPLKGQVLFVCAEDWYRTFGAKGLPEAGQARQSVFSRPSTAFAKLGQTHFRLAVVVIDDRMAQAGPAGSFVPKGRGRIPVFYLRVSDDLEPALLILSQANAIITLPADGSETLDTFFDQFVVPDSTHRLSNIRLAPELNDFPQRLSTAREMFERAFLLESFRLHGGNVSQTARALGISRRSLQLRLRKCGLAAPATQTPVSRDADASHATAAPSS